MPPPPSLAALITGAATDPACPSFLTVPPCRYSSTVMFLQVTSTPPLHTVYYDSQSRQSPFLGRGKHLAHTDQPGSGELSCLRGKSVT